MTLSEAKLIRENHKNLNGHIIRNGEIIISKILILPTKKEEYDKAIMYVFNHHLSVINEYEEKMSFMDVDVFVLYYDSKNDPNEKFNSPKVLPWKKFTEEIIDQSEMYSNIH